MFIPNWMNPLSVQSSLISIFINSRPIKSVELDLHVHIFWLSICGRTAHKQTFLRNIYTNMIEKSHSFAATRFKQCPQHTSLRKRCSYTWLSTTTTVSNDNSCHYRCFYFFHALSTIYTICVVSSKYSKFVNNWIVCMCAYARFASSLTWISCLADLKRISVCV